MNSRKIKVLSVVAASGLLGLALMITKPALAGENGQQLQACQIGTRADYQQAVVQGTNQDGNQATFSANVPKGGCFSTAGFFWVGNVSVTWKGSQSGQNDLHSTCNVPKEQEVFSLTDCKIQID